MKRTLSVLAISMIVLLSLAAKAQSGETTGTITDNSLIFKGYYQGSTQPSGGGQGSEDKSITLTFFNKDGQDINHDHQGGSTGTKVQADTSHQDSNTDTIFTWIMEGKTASEVTLRFTFSTMQAQVNGKYFRPTYTLTMTQDVTEVTSKTETYRVVERSYDNQVTWTENSRSYQGSSGSSSADYNDDPFYSSTSRTIGATKPENPSNSEYLETQTIEYIGSLSEFQATTIVYGTAQSKGKGNNRYYERTNTETIKSVQAWTRSGTCTLNVSDYEKDKPGDYVYSCWVIAEVTVE